MWSVSPAAIAGERPIQRRLPSDSGLLSTLKVFSAATQKEQATLWNGSEPKSAAMDLFPVASPTKPAGSRGPLGVGPTLAYTAVDEGGWGWLDRLDRRGAGRAMCVAW